MDVRYTGLWEKAGFAITLHEDIWSKGEEAVRKAFIEYFFEGIKEIAHRIEKKRLHFELESLLKDLKETLVTA